MRSRSPEVDGKPEEINVLEINGEENFRKKEWQQCQIQLRDQVRKRLKCIHWTKNPEILNNLSVRSMNRCRNIIISFGGVNRKSGSESVFAVLWLRRGEKKRKPEKNNQGVKGIREC